MRNGDMIELNCGDGIVVWISRHRDRMAVVVNINGWRRDAPIGYVGAVDCEFEPSDEEFLKQELDEAMQCRAYDEGYAEAKRIFNEE